MNVTTENSENAPKIEEKNVLNYEIRKFREIIYILPAFVSSSSEIIRAPKAPTVNNVNPMNHFMFTQFPERFNNQVLIIN